MREEFGVYRSICSCQACVKNCLFMPGFLIPADLLRMLVAEPMGTDAYAWAERNLLASPGALVMKQGEVFRVPTLVPATQPDGACIHLTDQGRCGIHEISPFGCAFFDCGREVPGLSGRGIITVYEDFLTGGLYSSIWKHLWGKKLRQKPAEELRRKMAGEMRT